MRRLIDLHPVRRREAAALADPAGTQERLLRELLRRASATEWGQEFGFEALAVDPDPVAAYRERVPIHGYEDLRDAVRRMREGQADVLWPGRIRHYAVSSGTVAAGKLIPMSAETARANSDFALAAALAYTAATGSARWLGGRLLTVPGRVEDDPAFPGTVAGEMSGLMYVFGPWYVKRFFQCVGDDVLFLPRWEDKLRAIARATCRLDVRSMAMVPSWAVVLFPMLVETYRKETGRPARTVRDVWPGFRVFFSGAVALSSYEALLREQIGGDAPMHFMESYGASEGVFSARRSPDDEDMVLAVDSGVYYEFVRMDDTGPTPRRYSLAEVEVGVRYRMLVSTCSGLWAYAVGDVIRFTSLRPHRIVVAGRTGEMLDRYGEAVFGEEARAAVEHAARETGSFVRDWHVTSLPPAGEIMPRHRWVLEFVGERPDLETFARRIDEWLQRVNRHYTIRRECGAFAAPELVAVPPDTFRAWLHATRDRVGAQTKVPRMREDPSVAEAVIERAETIHRTST